MQEGFLTSLQKECIESTKRNKCSSNSKKAKAMTRLKRKTQMPSSYILATYIKYSS